MSADRELLRLAAKAVGLQLNGAAAQAMYMGADGQWVFWNPLTDKIESRHIALKLGFHITSDRNEVWLDTRFNETAKPLSIRELVVNDDRDAAWCRIVVRAAAEIGKQMP